MPPVDLHFVCTVSAFSEDPLKACKNVPICIIHHAVETFFKLFSIFDAVLTASTPAVPPVA